MLSKSRTFLVGLAAIIEGVKRILNGFWLDAHVSSPDPEYRNSFSLFYEVELETANSTSFAERTGVWSGCLISKFVCCQMYKFTLTPTGAACCSCLAQVWIAFRHGGQTFTCVKMSILIVEPVGTFCRLFRMMYR